MSLLLQKLARWLISPQIDHLSNQPNLVMKHILRELDFKSMIILRKVSHELCDFIDNIRPVTNLSDITISIHPYKIRLNMEPYSEFPQLEYKKNRHGALICWYDEADGYKKEKLIRKEDFVNIAVNDLDIYLKLRRPVLPSLKIIFKPQADEGEEKELQENDTMRNTVEYFLRLLKAKLKSRAQPLQVKSFTMKSETLKHQQVMSILPFLKSKSLEIIEFLVDSPYFQAFQYRDREKVDMSELVGLEQWKRAKRITNLNFSETVPIKDYKHLEKVHFIFQTITSEYMIELKEIILQSTVFNTFKIEFLHFHDVYNLRNLFGKPFIAERPKDRHWYFWNPDRDYAIMFVLSHLRFVEFSQIELVDIPEDAMIV